MKQFYEGKKVLVTGGCGFIGSHLVERLVALGARVTIIDDLSGGFLRNVEKVKDNVNFIQDTITSKDVCLRAVENQEIIFHLAAFISVPESVEKPVRCHNVNVDGTVNLLEAARINGVERFVFSSSASVYGNCETDCTEEMPCQAQSPYGFSKYIGEIYCRQYAVTYGLKTVSLRYFNVYGPRQNPNRAYAAAHATFTQQMQSNKPITIYGDGMQTRDFIPVEKVAEANLILGMQNEEELNGQVFNIATGKSISVLELIEQIRTSFPNYSNEISFAPARPGDPKHSRANSSKYNHVLEAFYERAVG